MVNTDVKHTSVLDLKARWSLKKGTLICVAYTMLAIRLSYNNKTIL